MDYAAFSRKYCLDSFVEKHGFDITLKGDMIKLENATNPKIYSTLDIAVEGEMIVCARGIKYENNSPASIDIHFLDPESPEVCYRLVPETRTKTHFFVSFNCDAGSFNDYDLLEKLTIDSDELYDCTIIYALHNNLVFVMGPEMVREGSFPKIEEDGCYLTFKPGKRDAKKIIFPDGLIASEFALLERMMKDETQWVNADSFNLIRYE